MNMFLVYFSILLLYDKPHFMKTAGSDNPKTCRKYSWRPNYLECENSFDEYLSQLTIDDERVKYLKLKLTDNDSIIKNRWFENLSDLEVLDLSENSIDGFENGIFKNLHKLKTLHLQNSKLISIAVETLSNQNLEHIHIYNNKLKCDCGIEWLYIKIRNNEGTTTIKDVHTYPKFETLVYGNDLKCENDQMEMVKISSVEDIFCIRYQPWSSWSCCDDNGQQRRHRVCTTASKSKECREDDEQGCTGPVCSSTDDFHVTTAKPKIDRAIDENKDNNVNELPGTWNAWSDWSPCSKHCQMTRSRICSAKSQDFQPCVGDSVERTICFRNCAYIRLAPRFHIPSAYRQTNDATLGIIHDIISGKCQKRINVAIIICVICVICVNVTFYCWLLQDRLTREEENHKSADDKVPSHSKKSLQKRITESTRHFISNKTRGWIFKNKIAKDDNEPVTLEDELFQDVQGRFVKGRPKYHDGGNLPPIPVNGCNVYQQVPNEDAIYVNNKFLEHHLNTRKKIYQLSTSSNQKRAYRPLPQLPTNEYKDAELPPVPSYSDSPGSFKVEDPYISPVKHRRQLPETPSENPYLVADDCNENAQKGKTRNQRQLPETPRKNPYLIAVDIIKNSERRKSKTRRQLPETPNENPYLVGDSSKNGQRGKTKTRRQLPETPKENPYLIGNTSDEEDYVTPQASVHRVD